MEPETIGRNIKKYRIEKKLRQEDLAEKTDLSSNYIGMVERGEKIPSLETFISILNALEISADMVLADVLKQGYVVKNSLFSEDMKKLSQEDRERIYLVIETLIKYSQK
ncbi:MAG TPA: helix-turn-helix transcriptional regulator [Candidatus Limousia pullorum]|uniref:Helix-turn-helix transcriptional regulator n=1 Tax=Candidatus Limousia pullorum TaxID=2840860 RepID=A0A9D1LX47_9FIRM|nr:helix-turn-helix transcriptional regulator [Candidatus Limousia pullorum]